MPLEKWSDTIYVLHVADDPQFTEDLDAVEASGPRGCDLVLDFAAVHFVNSSNIAKLLRLRRQYANENRRMILCNVSTQVWSTLLVTGLDKLFEFTENVPVALASLQIQPAKKGK
jgi:anti-anti-sigma factor